MRRFDDEQKSQASGKATKLKPMKSSLPSSQMQSQRSLAAVSVKSKRKPKLETFILCAEVLNDIVDKALGNADEPN